MRSPGQNRFFSLLALSGLAYLAVRLGALRVWGLWSILLGSVVLVAAVVLTGALCSWSDWIAARRRAFGLTEIDEMEGVEFEHWVRDLLEQRGFHALLTPASDDRGVDIVAEREEMRCAVQVKRHHGLVSRHAVSDVVGGMKQVRLRGGDGHYERLFHRGRDSARGGERVRAGGPGHAGGVDGSGAARGGVAVPSRGSLMPPAPGPRGRTAAAAGGSARQHCRQFAGVSPTSRAICSYERHWPSR